MSKELELKKHSALVQISNKVTAEQRKCFNVLLYIAKDILKENSNTIEFKVDLVKIKKMAGISASNNQQIKRSLRDIANIVIEFNILNKDKKNEWSIFHLLSRAHIVDGSGILDFEFPKEIRETLLRPDIYVLLDLNIIKGLQSKYSIALYEFLRDYKNIKTVKIKIADFKKLMGSEKYYSDFNKLRDRVISPAIGDINEKTDLNVSHKEINEGKKIVALQFFIEEKIKKEKSVNVVIENSETMDVLVENKTKSIPKHKKLEFEFEEFILDRLKKEKKLNNPRAVLNSIKKDVNQIESYRKEFEAMNNKKIPNFQGSSAEDFAVWFGEIKSILPSEVEQLKFLYYANGILYLTAPENFPIKIFKNKFSEIGQKIKILIS